MSERYESIRNEVTKPKYDGMTPAQIFGIVTAPTVPTLRPVTPGEITRVLQKRDRWHTIVIWATRVVLQPSDAGTAAWAKVGVAMRIVEAINRRTDFDLSDPETLAAVTAGLDGLVTAGLLDVSDKEAVLALADTHVSIALLSGWADVSEQDIATERAR